ncbi:MAG: transporter [Georgfuchsia sp.]
MLLAAPTFGLQPLVTDDTGTQGAGGKQLEVAYERERCRDSGDTDYAHSVPLVFTYGMSEALDIGLGVAHQRINPADGDGETGAGNPVLGAKYRFYENDTEKLSFAVKPEIVLPVSQSDEARGLGTGKTSYALSLLATQKTSFGSLIATLAAFRINYRDSLLDADARNNQFLASIAALWNVGEQWQIGGEVGTYTQEDRALDNNSRFAQLASIWSPNGDTDVALGIKRDFNTGSAVIWATTLGLTYRFR